MKKLIIMVGVAGSGKTTIARDIFKRYDDVSLISSDEIRGRLGLGQDSPSHAKVFKEVNEIIETLMIIKQEVIIVDATNLKKYFRKNYIKLADKYGYEKITYVVKCDTEKCLANNERRGYTVPSDVIIRQSAYYEPPCVEEGWDEINEITSSKEKPSSLWSKLTRLIKRGK